MAFDEWIEKAHGLENHAPRPKKKVVKRLRAQSAPRPKIKGFQRDCSF